MLIGIAYLALFLAAGLLLARWACLLYTSDAADDV